MFHRKVGWLAGVLCAMAFSAAAIAAPPDDASRPGDQPAPTEHTTTESHESSAGEMNDPSKINDPIDLFDLSLEELMELEVTSVAGVRRPWFSTPAAMYVLTPEQIRRHGHRSIPEALRMVPGVHVARVDSRNWAISTRGFNSLFANKQLVLIDGRTVYNQLFSGVFWDAQDVLLADLERIEVVRGPGATLWGANAVNGVINVTTKPADETQGFYVEGGGGNVHQGFGAVRYGGKIDDDTFFRVWAKYENTDSFERPDGSDRPDDWDFYHVGARMDRYMDLNTTMTLQADYYGSRRLGEGFRQPVPGAHATFTEDVGNGHVDGAYVLGRLKQEDVADKSGWSVQSYWSWEDRTAWAGTDLNRHTFDLDARYHAAIGESHEIIGGLGYRMYYASNDPSATVGLDFDHRTTHLFTGFIQDTITVVPDTLFVMIGSKFEHNSYTGFEFQPSGRVWWTPDENQTIWAAISRPVRTPSLAEDDVRLTTAYVGVGPGNTAPYVTSTISGNRDVESEELLAFEFGYRVRPIEDMTVSIATFFNEYDELLSTAGGLNPVFGNVGDATTFGVEVSGTWQVTPRWRVTGSYSFLNQDFRGPFDEETDATSVQHMGQVRSEYDLTKDLELNAAFYVVDTPFGRAAPLYGRLDLGLTWRPQDNLELSVHGQNLLDPSHPEWVDPFFQGTVGEVPRAVYFRASMRF